tara:strand:- start:3108 stop:3269 length:162 start_codon:yes stop_codon:yes gene_type:complete
MIPKLIIKGILKRVATEELRKYLLLKLGDILVKSSKNKLDDKLWKKVKSALQK